MTGNNLYATENLYEAAYCLSRGHRLRGKERRGKKMTVFLEGKDPHLTGLEFYDGSEAKKLFDAYRTLKDFVFQGK